MACLPLIFDLVHPLKPCEYMRNTPPSIYVIERIGIFKQEQVLFLHLSRKSKPTLVRGSLCFDLIKFV